MVQFKDKAREKQRQRALKQQQQQQAGQQGTGQGPCAAEAKQESHAAAAAARQRAQAAAAAAAAAEEKRLPAAKRRMLELRQDHDELKDDYRLLKKLKKGRASEVSKAPFASNSLIRASSKLHCNPLMRSTWREFEAETQAFHVHSSIVRLWVPLTLKRMLPVSMQTARPVCM